LILSVAASRWTVRSSIRLRFAATRQARPSSKLQRNSKTQAPTVGNALGAETGAPAARRDGQGYQSESQWIKVSGSVDSCPSPAGWDVISSHFERMRVNTSGYDQFFCFYDNSPRSRKSGRAAHPAGHQWVTTRSERSALQRTVQIGSGEFE
jgi:hypothetical protein